MTETREVYTVPVGVAVQCHACRAKLEAGDQCWIMHDDSSTILCLRCAVKRKVTVRVGPSEHKTQLGGKYGIQN